MNIKKLTRHLGEKKGFTLIELIVVIAILAVLGGVAVPAYSAYVERANKQADITLVSEVAHALELAHYMQNLPNGGYVVLGPNGVVKTSDADDGTTAVTDALVATFGSVDSISGLKYDGWKGENSATNYTQTSYYGNEQSLLNEVDRLTNALGGAVKEYNIDLGTGFTDFLGHYDLSSSSSATEIGNAATLYVAQQTQGNEELIKQTFANNLGEGEYFINETYNDLRGTVGDAAALAAIYAYAEGFAQYCDAQEGSTTDAVNEFHNAANFENITDATAALNNIIAAFNVLGTEGQAYISDYMAVDGQGLKNVEGYVGIMGTVNDNKNMVDGNLAADDCYTDGTVENLLKGYTTMGSMNVTTNSGEIAVMFTPDGLLYYSDMELNAK